MGGTIAHKLIVLTFFLLMNNIISLSQDNQQITFQRKEDGYINATALCNSANKSIGSYLRNQTTQEFLKELEAVMQIRITELVQVKQGGEPHLQGSWVHPQVAVNLAQWLSPKFAVQVSKWVNNWVVSKQTPQITSQDTLYQLAEGLLQERQSRLEAETHSLEYKQEIEHKEKVIAKYIAVKEEKNYTDTAGILGISRKDFLEYLRGNGYIAKKGRRPTMKSVNLKIIRTVWRERGYESFLITPKGIAYFKQKLCLDKGL